MDCGQEMHMDMGMDVYRLVIYNIENISSVYTSLIIIALLRSKEKKSDSKNIFLSKGIFN